MARHQRAAHALEIDALPVVLHADLDRVAFVARGDGERALRRLAEGEAHLGRLDAVRDRVAHQVEQRLGHALDHRLVDLGLLAGGDEADLLALAPRQLAQGRLQPREQPADRHHAHAADAFLQRARGALQPFGVFARALRRAHQAGEHVVELGGDLADARGDLGRGLERLDLDQRGVERGAHLGHVAHAAVELLQPAHDARAIEHQLGRRVHQLVDALHLDAHGLRIGIEAAFDQPAIGARALGERAARRHAVVVVTRAAAHLALGLGDARAQLVDVLLQLRELGGAQRSAAIAQRDHAAFERVRQLRQLEQLHRAGRALEGVQLAQDRRQRRAIGGVGAQLGQALDDRLEVLGRLVEEERAQPAQLVGIPLRIGRRRHLGGHAGLQRGDRAQDLLPLGLAVFARAQVIFERRDLLGELRQPDHRARAAQPVRRLDALLTIGADHRHEVAARLGEKHRQQLAVDRVHASFALRRRARRRARRARRPARPSWP